MEPKDRIIVALDVPNLANALPLVEQLAPEVGMFKVGSQLYTAEGPAVIKTIQERGGGIFLDLKYHDIPNTVAEASREAIKLGVQMFNVHCSGGIAMMQVAVKAAEETVAGAETMLASRPVILGVTVLTSLDYATLYRMGFVTGFTTAEIDEQARRRGGFWNKEAQEELEREHVRALVKTLAQLAKEAGLDGVVASPQEIRVIREACGPNFLIVTPGIRLAGAEQHDQARVGTPRGAIAAGADYLVTGRPILQAPDPVEAAKHIAEEITAAMAERKETP